MPKRYQNLYFLKFQSIAHEKENQFWVSNSKCLKTKVEFRNEVYHVIIHNSISFVTDVFRAFLRQYASVPFSFIK